MDLKTDVASVWPHSEEVGPAIDKSLVLIRAETLYRVTTLSIVYHTPWIYI